MGKEVKSILKTKQAFSLKNFFVKAGVWIGLFAIGIGSALGFVGCGPDVPIDSSSSWEPDVSETDTTLPDPKPPVEDQTSTQTPGEDESSSTKPDPKPPVEDETTITPIPVVANEISFHALTFPEEAGDNATWNEQGQTHVVDLKGELGCVEINAGGDYTCTSVIFGRPVIGSVSHVVVDYTGWQNPDTG